MFNKLGLYTQLLERLQGFCAKLLAVRQLPTTYESCLAEVQRRATFSQQYSVHALSWSETVSTARESEVAAVRSDANRTSSRSIIRR